MRSAHIFEDPAELAGIVRDIVFDEVRRAAEAAGMPQGFVDALEFNEIGPGEYEIVNDWSRPPDKWRETPYPLAKWFEYGTDRHWVAPRGKAAGFSDVLTWIRGDPDKDRPQAIYSKSYEPPEGTRLFSKGHYVSGIPAIEPMHRGFEQGLRRLQDYLAHHKVAVTARRQAKSYSHDPTGTGGGAPF